MREGIEYRGLAELSPRRGRIGRPPMPPHLSPHQEYLVQRLCEGKTVKEAAHQLGITPGTAKEYIVRARKRLGMRTTLQMAAWYLTRRS